MVIEYFVSVHVCVCVCVCTVHVCLPEIIFEGSVALCCYSVEVSEPSLPPARE